VDASHFQFRGIFFPPVQVVICVKHQVCVQSYLNTREIQSERRSRINTCNFRFISFMVQIVFHTTIRNFLASWIKVFNKKVQWNVGKFFAHFPITFYPHFRIVLSKKIHFKIKKQSQSFSYTWVLDRQGCQRCEHWLFTELRDRTD
jgi:hypothetical protein